MLKKQENKIGAVVLAAGQGTRLRCKDVPKVMLEIGGKPIVSYIVDTLKQMGLSKEQIVLVVGYKKEKVKEYFGDSVTYANQEEQLGTAHAAYVGMQVLPKDIEQVIVLGGDDSAFYTKETLEDFITKHTRGKKVLSLLTTELNEDTRNIGRVVRDDAGGVTIIEKENMKEKDWQSKEISTGTFCFKRDWYELIFSKMKVIEGLGEYGLPVAPAIAQEENVPFQVVKMRNNKEWFGINTPEELDTANKLKNNK